MFWAFQAKCQAYCFCFFSFGIAEVGAMTVDVQHEPSSYTFQKEHVANTETAKLFFEQAKADGKVVWHLKGYTNDMASFFDKNLDKVLTDLENVDILCFDGDEFQEASFSKVAQEFLKLGETKQVVSVNFASDIPARQPTWIRALNGVISNENEGAHWASKRFMFVAVQDEEVQPVVARIDGLQGWAALGFFGFEITGANTVLCLGGGGTAVNEWNNMKDKIWYFYGHRRRHEDDRSFKVENFKGAVMSDVYNNNHHEYPDTLVLRNKHYHDDIEAEFSKAKALLDLKKAELSNIQKNRRAGAHKKRKRNWDRQEKNLRRYIENAERK